MKTCFQCKNIITHTQCSRFRKEIWMYNCRNKQAKNWAKTGDINYSLMDYVNGKLAEKCYWFV